ncbi:MAG: N-acetyltransferase [Deltaproteobacteria bacterium]|nr:N-acetyltransferase [Deltaproteobacteria bacterium]
MQQRRRVRLRSRLGRRRTPRLGLQYHWSNRASTTFDADLASLRHKRRKEVKRELRAVEEAGVRIETRAGSDIPEACFAPVWRFHRGTIDHNPCRLGNGSGRSAG